MSIYLGFQNETYYTPLRDALSTCEGPLKSFPISFKILLTYRGLPPNPHSLGTWEVTDKLRTTFCFLGKWKEKKGSYDCKHEL